MAAIGGVSFASSINDDGVVVGSVKNARASIVAVICRGGKMSEIVPHGGSSWAYDVHADGRVVGWRDVGGNRRHAVLFGPGSRIKDLGTLGGSESYAYAINRGGQVVGASTITGDANLHPFLYTDAAGMKDLGGLGGDEATAFGVNAAGQVVGTAQTAAGQARAFISGGVGGALTDLNALVDPRGIGPSNVRGGSTIRGRLPAMQRRPTATPMRSFLHRLWRRRPA